MTEPVLMTFVSTATDGGERAVYCKAVIAVIGTPKGYMLAAVDAEDGSTICTSSPDLEYRLTPLEAIQLLIALDGIQIVTLIGEQKNRAEEFNQLIQALRGTLYGFRLARLAEKFGERHPEAWIIGFSVMPSPAEMAGLMEYFSCDRGHAFYVSAHHVVAPYMKQHRLIGSEEIWWLRNLTFYLDC